MLVTPTAPTVAFRIGEKAENPLEMYQSRPAYGAGQPRRHPGYLGPLRREPEGLPIGLQLLGPALGEGLLLRVGSGVRSGGGGRRERPKPRLEVE